MIFLSAYLIMFDEEHNLPRVLDSMRVIADEIVVDCGSMDRKVEIVRMYGAKIVNHSWTCFAERKNIAAAAARYDQMSPRGLSRLAYFADGSRGMCLKYTKLGIIIEKKGRGAGIEMP
jgi:glycosyltransferase involved in cell wall biosynthesis